ARAVRNGGRGQTTGCAFSGAVRVTTESRIQVVGLADRYRADSQRHENDGSHREQNHPPPHRSPPRRGAEAVPPLHRVTPRGCGNESTRGRLIRAYATRAPGDGGQANLIKHRIQVITSSREDRTQKHPRTAGRGNFLARTDDLRYRV